MLFLGVLLAPVMNVLKGLKMTLRNFSPFSLAVSVVLVLDSKLWACNIRLGEETVATGLRWELGWVCEVSPRICASPPSS